MKTSETIPHARPDVSDAEIEAVTNALRAGHLAQGEEVARLEQSVSEQFDGAEVVAVASGTAALTLALRAMRLEAGSGVALPSYTCNSLYAAVCHAGMRADCMDVESGIPCLDAGLVRSASTSPAAAIVPHTFGYLADIDAIKATGVPVIEDCAHAFGGRFADGARIGSKGDISVVSFYATKIIPAGEGGLCITRNAEWADRIRRLRDCDEAEPDPEAFNFKLSDIHAALASARLDRLEHDIDIRSSIAQRYDTAFGEQSHRARAHAGVAQPACYRYLVVPASGPDAFMLRAAEAGVTCRRPVYAPLHRALGGECPNAERFHDSVVSVPLYPGLTEEEVATITHVLPGLCERGPAA